jgi:Fic family protein
MQYNWQHNDWPHFRYQILQSTEDALYTFIEETGHMNGILKTLPQNIQMEAIIDIMVSEAIKTSEIEGEYLSRPDVMSSIRNNLGLNKQHEVIRDGKPAVPAN